MEEGYIKYKCHLTERELELYPEMNVINTVRSELIKLKMIGVYPSGISYGNVSIRLSGERFIITGTQTGAFDTLLPDHFTIVNESDIQRNSIECIGLRLASSESLTHSAFYKSSEIIMSVIHIHNLNLWRRLLYKVPTIPEKCEYGTPEIADAVSELINSNEHLQSGIVALAGHYEGIISYGADLNSALEEIKKYV